jgi:multiple sugar transport system permease protein
MNITTNMENKKEYRHKWAGPLFAAPQFILFIIFLLIPTFYGFYISMFQWHILVKHHTFIGLQNYTAVLHDDIFWIALRNTVYYVILSVPLGNLVSLLLAVGISQAKKLTTVYKVCFYLPTIISVAVVCVLWSWMYNSDMGIFNNYLKVFHDELKSIGIPLAAFQPIPWLSDVKLIMPSITIMSVWWGAGANMILYLAGLNNIPKSLYEAAVIDGANSWQKFWSVTWPLLKPTTLFCLVLSVLGAFQIFAQSYILFQGDSGTGRAGLTLALYMFQQGFGQFQMGYGTAIAYLIFLIVLVLTLIEFKVLGRKEEF